MNTLKIKVTTLAILLIASSSSLLFAQSENPDFKMETQNQKYDIVAKLPNDGTLIIHFKKITDWNGKEELNRITKIGIQQYQNLQDSFKTDLSQKVLSIKLPVNENLMAIQYTEKNAASQNMVFKDGTYFVLKSSYDTLTILKDEGINEKVPKYEDSADYKRLIQYSFVLKDLHNITDLDINSSIDKIGSQIDSVVDKYLKKWKYPNTVDKSLTIQIDSNIIFQNYSSFFKHITADYGFGIELFNSKLATTINLGYAYVWNKNNLQSGYLGLNVKTYTFPKMDYKNSSQFYSANIEFGTANTTTGSLNNKSAIGLGYFFGNFGYNNVDHLGNMFRMYLSYSITKHINFELDLMSNFKISEKAIAEGKNSSVWGLSLNYSIFN